MSRSAEIVVIITVCLIAIWGGGIANNRNEAPTKPVAPVATVPYSWSH